MEQKHNNAVADNRPVVIVTELQTNQLLTIYV